MTQSGQGTQWHEDHERLVKCGLEFHMARQVADKLNSARFVEEERDELKAKLKQWEDLHKENISELHKDSDVICNEIKELVKWIGLLRTTDDPEELVTEINDIYSRVDFILSFACELSSGFSSLESEVNE